MGPFQIDKPLTPEQIAQFQAQASGGPDDGGYVRDAQGNVLYNTSQPVFDEKTPVGLGSKALGAAGIDTPGKARENTSWWDATKNTVKQFLPYTNERESVVPDAVAGLAAPFEINHKGLTQGPDAVSDREKAEFMMGVAGTGGIAAGLAKGSGMLGRAGSKIGLTDPLLAEAPAAAAPTTAFANGDDRLGILASEFSSPQAYERAKEQGFISNGDSPYYHATTHDITDGFRDPKEPANQSSPDKPGYMRDSHHGPGIYMTSKLDDASANYLEDGPDLTGRVNQSANRQLEDSPFQYGTQQYADARENALRVARSELIGDSADIHPLVVRPSKVVDVNTRGKRMPGGFGQVRYQRAPRGKDTFFDYDNAHTADTDEFGDPVGSGLDLLGATEKRLKDTRAGRNDMQQTLADIEQYMMEDQGIPASAFEGYIRNSDRLYDAYEQDGPFSGPGEMLQQIYRDLGYDAIRHNNADQTFDGLKMSQDTSHLTMFDPEKIRRLDAQFDPNRRHESGLYYSNGVDPRLAPFMMMLNDEEPQQ